MPGERLYEQYTTRGKRLVFEGADGERFKVRLRSNQVRVYDSALRPVGRVRMSDDAQIIAASFEGEDATSAWISEDVAELSGHWRVERADERWAIFDARGQLLGLLQPPRPREGAGSDAAAHAPQSAELPDDLSADDHILYAALTSPGAASTRHDGLSDEGDSAAPEQAEPVGPEAISEVSRAAAAARSAALTATARNTDEADAPADDATQNPATLRRAPAHGWSLARDYRDSSPLTIDRSEARPRAIVEGSDALIAPPAAARFSDAALLALTLGELPPLSRQALASWLDRNLIEEDVREREADPHDGDTPDADRRDAPEDTRKP
ncbi:hypothetical protein FRC98_01355 [Lujinxingia vulgaris]|uniref:Uncharacterized protein n=1 Tax=Lujinxingia vulgaris TaxID=2600176 RepID=A0A5C6XNV2_9DELT|nr:hypothetical protein [Lujinxingia vulgaris]TXD39079.1 hypothetical protein FRC98_01355 [Lujinxingia vulgaris]